MELGKLEKPQADARLINALINLSDQHDQKKESALPGWTRSLHQLEERLRKLNVD